MLCEKCGNKPAVVRLTKVINNKKSVMNLCADCAEDVQGSVTSPVFDGFGSLLSGLAGIDSLLGQPTKRQKSKRACPVCKNTITSINAIGKLGCSECYVTFIEELRPLLRKIHGNCVHIGAVPYATEQDSSAKNDSGKEAANDEKHIMKGRKDAEAVDEGCTTDKTQIQILREMMHEAIEKEDFEKAAELRDKIKMIEQEGGNNE